MPRETNKIAIKRDTYKNIGTSKWSSKKCSSKPHEARKKKTEKGIQRDQHRQNKK